MKRFINISLFVLSLLAISCQEEIKVENLRFGDPVFIVEGSINDIPDSSHKITLSWATPYFEEDDDSKYETGAKVSINDGEKNYQLLEREKGQYYTDSSIFKPVPGKTYTLNIELKNGDKYYAKETMATAPEIDSLKVIKQNVAFFTESIYMIIYYGQDSPIQGDCYMWNMYLNDSLVNDTINESVFIDDNYFNGQYIADFPVYSILEKDLSRDTSIVRIEVNSISQQYYNFLYNLMTQVSNGGLFSTAPANIAVTNIVSVGDKNKTMGYFNTASVKYSEVKLIKSLKRP